MEDSMYSDFERKHVFGNNLNADELGLTDSEISMILKVIDSILIEQTSTYTPLYEVDGRVEISDEYTGPYDYNVTVSIPSEQKIGTHRISDLYFVKHNEMRIFTSQINNENVNATSTHSFSITTESASEPDKNISYSLWINLGVDPNEHELY